jgi:antiphage defense system Thoeris ThsB-like protein
MGSQDDYVSALLRFGSRGRGNSLLGLVTPPTPANALWPTPNNALGNVLATTPPKVKRRAYFSFHFDDIMRVNNVRNAWKIDHPDNALYRSFEDSSIWERRQLEGDDAVKRLIREGVQHTSAVCVLGGTETWRRRWVRYEIARAVIDGRGLLTVHINGLNHHQTLRPDVRGENPLGYLAVGKVQPNARYPKKYYLFERQAEFSNGQYRWVWNRYADYTDPIDRPAWLADCQPGYVTPLSTNAAEYDYVAQIGHKNIGSWIDAAARQAAR